MGKLTCTLFLDVNTILFAADANKNIEILHSFRNFGETILKPIHDFGCLIGHKATSIAIKVVLDSIVKQCSVRSTMAYSTYHGRRHHGSLQNNIAIPRISASAIFWVGNSCNATNNHIHDCKNVSSVCQPFIYFGHH